MAFIIREAPAKQFTDKLSLQTAVQAHPAEQWHAYCTHIRAEVQGLQDEIDKMSLAKDKEEYIVVGMAYQGGLHM